MPELVFEIPAWIGLKFHLEYFLKLMMTLKALALPCYCPFRNILSACSVSVKSIDFKVYIPAQFFFQKLSMVQLHLQVLYCPLVSSCCFQISIKYATDAPSPGRLSFIDP